MNIFKKEDFERVGWTIQNSDKPECPDHGKMNKDQYGDYWCPECNLHGGIFYGAMVDGTIVAVAMGCQKRERSLSGRM